MSIRAFVVAGITPAYAGNTIRENELRYKMGDHPRLRGEHYQSSLKDICGIGSPPPTRGTLIYNNNWIMYFRITPAYAGNTSEGWPELSSEGDHPRLRGEHQAVGNPEAQDSGSPPPTRGTLGKFAMKHSSLRITPAYAGNTANLRHMCNLT